MMKIHWIPGALLALTVVVSMAVAGGTQDDSRSLFTESSNYGDEDVVWWEGRRVGGVAVGVIQLQANIPMIPGNVGNATTFPFPLMFEPMDVTGEMVVSAEPHPEVIERAIAAAQKLEAQGCRAIVGNCGFFANYQPQVAAAIDVPFYSSSLLQIPQILVGLGAEQKIGVITADGPKLEAAPALENCGLTDRERVVIVGAHDSSEMRKILSTAGHYNPRKLEQDLVEIAKRMVAEEPQIGAILLECTELSPHAFAVQRAVGLPVWDFTTLIEWVESGLVRGPFTGSM